MKLFISIAWDNIKSMFQRNTSPFHFKKQASNSKETWACREYDL